MHVPRGPVGPVKRVKAALAPMFAWVDTSGRSDPVDGLQQQGWRMVGYDADGQPLYAPPSRYSIWL